MTNRPHGQVLIRIQKVDISAKGLSPVAKPHFVDHPLSQEIEKLARSSDHRTLAIWAADCAERVLPLFMKEHPEDDRPWQSITKLRGWIDNGEFHMDDVRRASLNAHAAARSAPEGSPARFAARACGQAMATAHVKTHSIAAAWYAAKAVWAGGGNAEGVRLERGWQFDHLVALSDRPSVHIIVPPRSQGP